VLGSGVLVLDAPEVRADTPATIQIAIPANVVLIQDQHVVIFIGKPVSISTVNCAPGFPFPQTVVAVDPGGGRPSEITGVLAFHDHEIPNGARYRIRSDGGPCNADLRLYSATLE
jgi:hypothetical protein